MICDNCGAFYPDDEVPEKCTVCDQPLKGSTVRKDAQETVASTPPEDVPAVAEPPRPLAAAMEEKAWREPETFDNRQVERERDTFSERKAAPDWVTSEPPRAIPAQPLRPSVVAVQPVKPAPPSKDDTPLDPQYMETISSFDEKEAIITVIGYGGSGKTFFVNRLRHNLAGSWKRKPPPADEIPISPKGIELTRFTPRHGGPSYLALDCAGESFAHAFRTQAATEALTGEPVRPYLAALTLARAFVLVIKAKQLVTFSQPEQENESDSRREDRKFIRGILNEFDDIIHAIVIVKSRLANGETPESIIRRGISKEELKLEFKKARRCSQPMYVALSLADRLEKLQGGSYDMDPFLFALEKAPILFKTIDASFNHYRFDYLTAFDGHVGWDEDDEGDETLKLGHEKKPNIRPDYTLKSYGAVEAFQWIHSMVGAREQRDGLPTRELVELRRKTDPRFRAAWGRS